MEINNESKNYLITIYSKLSDKQKNKLVTFLKSNFVSDIDKKMQLFSGTCETNINFELQAKTIIILNIEDDKIKGCVCILYNKHLKEKLINNNVQLDYYHLSEDRGCFIYNLCVDKNLRNQNIATNLIQYTINKMKELDIVYLHTHAENEISKNVFLKNHFDVINKNQNIYIMAKYI